MASKGDFLKVAIAFLYPAYKSLEAMGTVDHEDDMVWLKYWVVLAAISLLEIILDPLFNVLPGYLLSKCIFLVWCMVPGEHSGANVIFNQVRTTL